MRRDRGKQVAIIIRSGPFNTLCASEAFRTGVGLTLSEHKVTFLLVQDGAYHLMPLQGKKIGRPSMYDFIAVFEEIGITLCVDADDMLVRKIERIPAITRQLPRTEVFQMIRDADVVIPFQ